MKNKGMSELCYWYLGYPIKQKYNYYQNWLIVPEEL